MLDILGWYTVNQEIENRRERLKKVTNHDEYCQLNRVQKILEDDNLLIYELASNDGYCNNNSEQCKCFKDVAGFPKCIITKKSN